MKRTLLSLIIIPLSLLTVAAQDIVVPQTNQPLITKRTASWCVNCGTWGWNLFEGLLADNQDNALLIAAHYSGDHQNETASDIVANFGGFGQPTFFLNNENLGANSSNSAAVRTSVKESVEMINTEPPLVQAGINAGADDTYTLFVDIRAEFFQATEGLYTVGVYLIEKSFTGAQTPIGSSAEHKQLLRMNIPANFPYSGEMIASGSIAAGTAFEASYTLTPQEMQSAGVDNLDDLFNGSFEVATVIWKETAADQFEAINTNQATIEGIFLDANEIQHLSAFDVQPTISREQTTAVIDLEQALKRASLSLYTMSGQLARTVFQGEMAAGENRFTIARQALPSGNYLLRLESGQQQMVKRISFQ